jgi:hypothetical protein
VPPAIATRSPVATSQLSRNSLDPFDLPLPTDVNLVCVDGATGITLRTQFKTLSRQWEFCHRLVERDECR